MATITGKRFQITDGASTPTNLFPYTVSEAVYGLSNTISNAISTALSALSLSTYAGTSAIGSATQPVYYNGSALVATNLSTTYAPYNANGYLPLTGGTIRSASSYARLRLVTDATIAYVQAGTSDGDAGNLYLSGFNTGVGSNLYLKFSNIYATGSNYTVYHSGNSNSTSVDWSAKNLTVAYNSYLHFLNPAGNGDCGYIIGYEGNYGNTLSINGSATILLRTGGTTAIQIDSSQNVGIGTTSPAYKLDVNGSIGCSTLAARVSSTAQILLETGQRNNAREGGGIAFWKGSYHFGEINASVLALNPRSGGNVGIGTTSPSQKLHVVGNLLSTGDQVVSSDATLKTNLADITYSVADIAKAPAVTFDWKDGRGRSAGSIAQYWKNVLPELVHGEEGNMSLAYGQLALVNTILLARQSESLVEQIERLEARVAELEMENKRLRMN